ncbi:MAG: A/G-specific adenine glycosylase [Pirellulales bacterium]
MAARALQDGCDTNSLPDARWRRTFERGLRAWYRRHRRDLPWRQTADPYAIWVSEIMLQQTQVATVVPYFARFLAAFPDIRTLAAAPERDVLRQWEGLGYYRRARQMHQAARVLVEHHGGRFPRDLEAVRALPGIGRYTAGAIVSIAFDQPAPILEANTVRLLSRLVAYQGNASDGAGQRQLWDLAAGLLPDSDCGEFNQALMELGSLVCTPRAPGCGQCPASALCAAHRQHDPERFPRLRPKPQTAQVREAAVVVRRGEKVLLRRCASGERWAGLWDFLRFPVQARRGAALERELVDGVRAQAGFAVRPPLRIATFKHTVTRFRITLDCYETACGPIKKRLSADDWQWVRIADLADYPLSTTGRKLAKVLSAE